MERTSDKIISINSDTPDDISENTDERVFNGYANGAKKINISNLASNFSNLKLKNNNFKRSLNSNLFKDDCDIQDLNIFSFGEGNLFPHKEYKNEDIKIPKKEKDRPILKKIELNNNCANKTHERIMSFNQPELDKDINKTENIINNLEEKSLFMTTEGREEIENKNEKFFNPFQEYNTPQKSEKLIDNYTTKNNFLRVAEVNNGLALVVTEDDMIFTLPAFLLPKGAKIGEYFEINIKAIDNNYYYQKIKAKEIDQIQKKYISK